MPSSWLPPEVGGVCQPYSMLPLLRRTGHREEYASPAMGTLVPLDRSELSLRMALVAPSKVQRAAQQAGVTQMVMIRPKGIEKVNPVLTPTAAAIKELGIADVIEGLD